MPKKANDRVKTDRRDARKAKQRLLHFLLRHEIRSPPNNRSEKLKGNLRGLYSIRVNEQWRIVLRWSGEDVHEVLITDYH